jgi:peptidoglycan/xylan/chitin deacetylase (PgdA/CDA1 family)
VKPGDWLQEDLLARIARKIQQGDEDCTAEVIGNCVAKFSDLRNRNSVSPRLQSGSRSGESTSEARLESQEQVRRMHSDLEDLPVAERIVPGGIPLPQKGDRQSCGLTFDSGPHPMLTHRVLDALDECGMKGTFFLVGMQIKRGREVVHRMAAAGHEIAVQGYGYEDLSKATYAVINESVDRTLGLISDVTGVVPRWFRPRRAQWSALVREVCCRKGLRPVGWHVSSGDWTGQHHTQTVSTVLAYGLEGAVVLFHDGSGDPLETARAIKELGSIARRRGILGRTLSDFASRAPVPTP